jgi:hypothetical protein
MGQVLPQMQDYDASTNTFIDVDGNRWAFDQSGNASLVGADYINPWVPTAAGVQQATSDTGTDIAKMATSALTALQTYQLNNVNVERAKQGLPPINTAAYGTGINVGLNQQTQQLVIYGGLALLAVLLVGQLRK